MPPPTLPLARALDDPGEVQQLYLRVVVVDDAGDARQRRELVRRHLAVRPREFREQRGLPHGREPDERDAPVAVLGHLEAVLVRAARLGRREELRAELGELGL